MKKSLFNTLLIVIVSLGLSCNMFYVAMGNIPVFFSSPEKIPNKVKQPVSSDVRLSALWIGHSTVLIQMDDKVIITDPFLTETYGEMGRRLVEPGIDIENIPRCDLILLSHPHFDHLNLESLEMLEEKSKGSALVFPNDLENYLPNYDYKFYRMKNDYGYKSNFIGETKMIDGIKVTTVVANHWGGRFGFDGYLWGDKAYTGYILEYNSLTLYFAGDTGYDTTAFKKIGENFNIDLALIPIGPCADCEQCGTKNHVFPTDALMIFKDVKAKWMVPIHFGTLHFQQGDAMAAAVELRKLILQDSLQKKVFVLKIGEQKKFILNH